LKICFIMSEQRNVESFGEEFCDEDFVLKKKRAFIRFFFFTASWKMSYFHVPK